VCCYRLSARTEAKRIQKRRNDAEDKPEKNDRVAGAPQRKRFFYGFNRTDKPNADEDCENGAFASVQPKIEYAARFHAQAPEALVPASATM
jgi:hypothetical protein